MLALENKKSFTSNKERNTVLVSQTKKKRISLPRLLLLRPLIFLSLFSPSILIISVFYFPSCYNIYLITVHTQPRSFSFSFPIAWSIHQSSSLSSDCICNQVLIFDGSIWFWGLLIEGLSCEWQSVMGLESVGGSINSSTQLDSLNRWLINFQSCSNG